VQNSAIIRTSNTAATITLPAQTDAFVNYIFYYRIYISSQAANDDMVANNFVYNASNTANNKNELGNYNETMGNDFSSFAQYLTPTDTSTANPTDVSTLFSGKYYYSIQIDPDQNSGIASPDNLLSSSLLKNGGIVIFDFNANKIPTMQINGGTLYKLIRSTGDGAFTPEPGTTDHHGSFLRPYFQNDSVLNNPDKAWSSINVGQTINRDVATSSSVTAQTQQRHTYAALFVAAFGFDTSSMALVYSTPTLVSIFALPDSGS
jgi:hypothetical protein